MDFKRNITKYLEDWKLRTARKPLVLRGARQVGKTTVVKHFSKTYKYAVLLNLERPADCKYFDDFTDVRQMMEAICLRHQIPSQAINQTLLFIDEIQESPKAIHLLRYFYEDVPDLHVIAAGSLLEFAIRDVSSFPVGRVEFLYLQPLNFAEYLLAMGQEAVFDQLHIVPLPAYAHGLLLELFHQYTIVGGMPEVVKTLIETKSIADLPRIYESLWTTYKHDIEKYASNEVDRKIIKHIMNVAHLSMSERIKFQNFGNSNYRSREVSEAFQHLDEAKVIQLIYPTTSLDVPLQVDLKKSPCLQFLDTGLLNYTLGIQADLLALNDFSKAYKGAIIPHVIRQELLSLNTISYHKVHFWVREKKQSNSEVDLVLPFRNRLIPIEIKSGSTGSLKSLHQFVDAVEHGYAVRIYGGAMSIENATTPAGKPYKLINLPYYLGTKLYEYLELVVND